MRSWLTLQPGEMVSCAGCHESKNSAPPAAVTPSLALRAGPQDLSALPGPARGFSFSREVQPILDRHCIRCHRDTGQWEHRLGRRTARTGSQRDADDEEVAFSLLDTPVPEDLAKRRWTASYLALVQATEQTLEGNRYLAGMANDLVNWVSAQSAPEMLEPHAAGSARSRLLSLLAEGHHEVRLAPDELETLACWIDLQVPFCGDYEEANLWTGDDRAKYRHFLEKRRRMEDLERRNIAEWLK